MMRRVLRRLLPVMLLCAAAGGVVWVAVPGMPPPVQRALGLRPPPATFFDGLADAAAELVDPAVVYDPSYVALAYPGGDVPATRGVCADVVIRAYRRVGIDLQVRVHKDMRRHFAAYPRDWGLRRPDRNIDHRRVYNLTTFFRRHGRTLPITRRGDDYRPGDIVAWRVAHQGHIGLVSRRRNVADTRYLIVHNIGGGQVREDRLFAYPIIGHYRYGPG